MVNLSALTREEHALLQKALSVFLEAVPTKNRFHFLTWYLAQTNMSARVEEVLADLSSRSGIADDTIAVPNFFDEAGFQIITQFGSPRKFREEHGITEGLMMAFLLRDANLRLKQIEQILHRLGDFVLVLRPADEVRKACLPESAMQDLAFLHED